MAVLDTIIIGAGPAGMTAAIYSKRKGMSLAIVSDSLGGQMSKTGNIENYPGFGSVSGPDLSRKMKEQMQRLGIEPVLDRVSGIERMKEAFRIRTEAGRSFDALTVILASGSHWREIGVPGEKEFINRGVSYCTTCDAPLFAGMDVAVVGGGNSAAESVLELAGIATKVYMIVRSRLKCDEITTERIRKNEKVTVFEGYAVKRIAGGDFVESIVIAAKDGAEKTLNVGGVFVEIGMDPNAGFVKGMVNLNSRGEIQIDDRCRTSAEGIFACGDVTTVPQKQVVVAAGEGAKAAMAAYVYLSLQREAGAPACTL